MKFGIHLLTNLTPEWDSQYILYEKLKQIIEKWADEAPISVNGEENPLRTQHFLKADDEFFPVLFLTVGCSTTIEAFTNILGLSSRSLQS